MGHASAVVLASRQMLSGRVLAQLREPIASFRTRLRSSRISKASSSPLSSVARAPPCVEPSAAEIEILQVFTNSHFLRRANCGPTETDAFDQTALRHEDHVRLLVVGAPDSPSNAPNSRPLSIRFISSGL